MSENVERDVCVLTKEPDLSISCCDTIDVRARMTFDSEYIPSVGRQPSCQITYWADDVQDERDPISAIFELLFEEVLKTRKEGEETVTINQ